MDLQTGRYGEGGLGGVPGMHYRRRKSTPTAPTARQSEASRIAGMAMSDFATAGLVLRVRSAVLGEEVIFASDNAEIAGDPGLPIYRAKELSRLLSAKECLQRLHAAKKADLDISNASTSSPVSQVFEPRASGLRGQLSVLPR